MATVAEPSQISSGLARAVVGLPATRCLTLPFGFPVSGDGTLVRRMVFAQLEKRALVPRGATPEDAPFACHRVGGTGEAGQRVSVDVLTGDLPDAMRPPDARSFAAAARFFPLPDHRLLVFREQGRWVVAAASGGTLVYTHVLGDASRPVDDLAADLQTTALTLESRGWTPGGIHGVVLWAGRSEADAGHLSAQLGIPVESSSRPAPDAGTAGRLARQNHLLPKPVRERQRRRRSVFVRAAVAVAALAGLVAVAAVLHGRLKALESRAATLEAELAASSDDAGAVGSAGARWRALRNVLEPKRYPLVHLDHLTRLMPDQGVVMTGFRSKVSELHITGTAADAMTAYAYYNAIRADDELGVYNWSMERPALDDDGTASFEVKGVMR